MQFSVYSRRSFFLFLLFTFISYPQPARPQNAVYESGVSYLRNFGYKEYGAHQQNWAVVEDHRGLVYVANNWDGTDDIGSNWY